MSTTKQARGDSGKEPKLHRVQNGEKTLEKNRLSRGSVLLWSDEKLPCKRRKGKCTLKTVPLEEPEDTPGSNSPSGPHNGTRRIWKHEDIEEFQVTESRFEQDFVDEVMIRYKGTGAGILRQYIGNTPDKWGFKVSCRASSSGIIHDLLLYQGASTFFNVAVTSGAEWSKLLRWSKC